MVSMKQSTDHRTNYGICFGMNKLTFLNGVFTKESGTCNPCWFFTLKMIRSLYLNKIKMLFIIYYLIKMSLIKFMGVFNLFTNCQHLHCTHFKLV